MLHKIKKYITDYNLLQPGDVVMVAVSGGPDSMALLHVFCEIRQEWDLRLAAAHVNHGLRKEAGEEEEFVRRYCEKWQVPFQSRRIDIRQLARQQKKSLETCAREYRYKFFQEVLQETGASVIATAHHQDDQAESVLLHLLRGSGLKGLRGIRPRHDNIIRPLLCVNKKEIFEYLHSNAVEHCIDSSNDEVHFLRNRIRHHLIPLLQEHYNPRMIENLNQLADIARLENEVIEHQVLQLWTTVVQRENRNLIELDVERLAAAHPAYRRRLILLALARLKGDYGWSMNDVERILDLSGKPGSARRIPLRKRVTVRKLYNTLQFTILPQEAPGFCHPVTIPGQIEIEATGEQYLFELLDASACPSGSQFTCLDYDKLPPGLCLRSRMPGDRYQPPGRKSPKKLKEYYIDLKIPLPQRNQLPLLACDSVILAIPGLSASPLVKVEADTRKVLLIKRLKKVQNNREVEDRGPES